MIVLRKNTVIKAFNKLKKDYINNQEEFRDVTIDEETGCQQLDDLLSVIEADAYIEDLTEFNINIVNAFIEHCKDNGVEIKESLFESFFNA